MIDTHNVRALKSTVASTGANFDAPVAYATVTPIAQENRRRDLSRGSLNPVDMTVQHHPRTAKQHDQRSLVAFEALRSRVDALGNVIGQSKGRNSFQSNIPPDMTLAEYIADVNVIVGFLVGNDYEGAKAIFAGER